ncbi:MAG TPA: radical SAM protein [Desulfobulbaceae bacterium]|nr:radical SAM protein [Desulfobulbaceae bacterium]
MKHIFGPVNSRRLGRSLGIDLLPKKICNFDCIYCEVGATTLHTCERREYVPTEDILAEIEQYCADPARLGQVDVVTVTASGEPTLHAGLGRIIRFLKERTGKPVAVLTNGTNLTRPDVVEELCQADIVIPSLDSALQESFRRLNRPAPCVDLGETIEGLVSFSHAFAGELWLEILVAKNVNDSREDIAALLRVIARMRLTRVQLNTVARPPLEKFALPVSQERLQEIAALIAAVPGVPRVDIIAHGISIFAQGEGDVAAEAAPLRQDRVDILEQIVQMLQRRPCTAADIDRIFLLGGPARIEQLLEPLVQSGRIVKRLHRDRMFYQYCGDQGSRSQKNIEKENV